MLLNAQRMARLMNISTIKTRLAQTKKRTVKMWKYGMSAILPYNPMNGDKSLLEAEYSGGVWDYLRDLNELARFSVVSGYCHFLKGNGSILEIGCGEGILQERLCPLKYSRFVGIDISAEAIRRTSRKQDHKTSFFVEDARVYHPNDLFDVIIFNECLEYFQDPLGLVQRYESFLETGGIYIVSMFTATDTARTKHIWKMLESVYPVEAQTRVSTRPGYTWNIKVLIPSKQQDKNVKPVGQLLGWARR